MDMCRRNDTFRSAAHTSIHLIQSAKSATASFIQTIREPMNSFRGPLHAGLFPVPELDLFMRPMNNDRCHCTTALKRKDRMTHLPNNPAPLR